MNILPYVIVPVPGKLTLSLSLLEEEVFRDELEDCCQEIEETLDRSRGSLMTG